MTPEKQRNALLEWAGWGFYPVGPEEWDWLKPHPDDFKKKSILNCRMLRHQPIPDYLNDLNAVHELEKRLTDIEYAKYRQKLWVVAAGSDRIAFKKLPENQRLSRGRAYHCATAAQRCEALLRTLGLWEENKE